MRDVAQGVLSQSVEHFAITIFTDFAFVIIDKSELTSSIPVEKTPQVVFNEIVRSPMLGDLIDDE